MVVYVLMVHFAWKGLAHTAWAGEPVASFATHAQCWDAGEDWLVRIHRYVQRYPGTIDPQMANAFTDAAMFDCPALAPQNAQACLREIEITRESKCLK